MFRIFDSLNWIAEHEGGDGHRPRANRRDLRGAICYTGDILDPKRTKYRPASIT